MIMVARVLRGLWRAIRARLKVFAPVAVGVLVLNLSLGVVYLGWLAGADPGRRPIAE
ncbi:MAG: hypothetical protein HY660_12760 [Armatimonadetes bacterium]|nr:hypothetical protein [Armatimonadota bacterium]